MMSYAGQALRCRLACIVLKPLPSCLGPNILAQQNSLVIRMTLHMHSRSCSPWCTMEDYIRFHSRSMTLSLEPLHHWWHAACSLRRGCTHTGQSEQNRLLRGKAFCCAGAIWLVELPSLERFAQAQACNNGPQLSQYNRQQAAHLRSGRG